MCVRVSNHVEQTLLVTYENKQCKLKMIIKCPNLSYH